jgi:hypothetical protein
MGNLLGCALDPAFEEVQLVLIEFRESTGYVCWKDWAKEGWDKLETYTMMEELRLCRGVFVEDGNLHGIELNNCNLTGKSLHRSSR